MVDQRVLKTEEQAVFALRSLYRRYGYGQYKMSRFEEYDLYVRNKDFLVSDEVITFTDRSGRLLALKPDVTLSIIKNTEDRPGTVQKVYYNEHVFRVASGTHTFKEIMQAGLECIGDLGNYEIAEVVLLALQSLALLERPYMLDLSHMGLLSATLEQSGLSPRGQQEALLQIHQKSLHELRALLEKEGITDTTLLTLAQCNGTPRQVLPCIEPLMVTPAQREAFAEFSALCAVLADRGYNEKVRVDFSVGNDMKYYSGVVFKGYLEGIPTGVLAGGRYDKLLHKLGRKSGAIGFAVYLDLLERLQREVPEYDVDTVMLYRSDADPVALTAAVEEWSRQGSVLAVTCVPEDVKYRRLVSFEGGQQQ